VEKVLQRKTSANISLFCNILDAPLPAEEFNILPQVIHISSTNHQPLDGRGFTAFSRRNRARQSPTTSEVISIYYKKLWLEEEKFET
jgi:hypothetical protein